MLRILGAAFIVLLLMSCGAYTCQTMGVQLDDAAGKPGLTQVTFVCDDKPIVSAFVEFVDLPACEPCREPMAEERQ